VAPQGAPSPFQTSPVSKSRFTRHYPCEPRTAVPISDSAESQDAGCSEEMSRHSAKVLQKKVRRSFEPPRASFCRSILTFADPFSCLQGKGALAAGLHRRDGGIWLIRCSCRSTLVSAMRCGYFRRCKRQRWLWLGLFSRCAV
jgi:hypothetical protein